MNCSSHSNTKTTSPSRDGNDDPTMTTTIPIDWDLPAQRNLDQPPIVRSILSTSVPRRSKRDQKQGRSGRPIQVKVNTGERKSQSQHGEVALKSLDWCGIILRVKQERRRRRQTLTCIDVDACVKIQRYCAEPFPEILAEGYGMEKPSFDKPLHPSAFDTERPTLKHLAGLVLDLCLMLDPKEAQM